MANEILSFAPLIPHGIRPIDKWTFDMSFAPRTVLYIEATVPSGPAGNMGFAIGSAGAAVIPKNPGQWIIANEQVFTWQLENFVNSGSWTFFGYNLGAYDHTVYVRFYLDALHVPDAAIPAITVPTLLSSQ